MRSLTNLASTRHDLAEWLLGAGTPWDVSPSFYEDILRGEVVLRTYLTFGWRYKARALRNRLSDALKTQLLEMQFPRFVWVTEFYSKDSALPQQPNLREVMGHAVVDATGSGFDDSPLVLDAPGLSIILRYDPADTDTQPSPRVLASETWFPSRPKVRGN